MLRPKKESRPQYRRWIATFVVVCLPAAAALAEIRYEVTDLSLFVGGNRVARAVNEAGQVIGGPVGTAGPGTEAFLWDPISGVQLLGIVPPFLNISTGTNLNHTGMVVGSVAGGVLAPVQHAFVWREETGLIDIGSLPFPTHLAHATAVNDSDLVVGNSIGFIVISPTEIVTISQAFLWDSAGGIRPLDGFGEANSINNAGQIVGQSFDPTPEDPSTGRRALLLDPVAGMQDLGTLPGTVTSVAADINEIGQIVGSSGDFAFIWQNGTMSPLDSGPLKSVSARAINNEGMVVGFSGTGTDVAALVWEGGSMHQLNDLIHPSLDWDLQRAFDINDRGQIVGFGTRAGYGSALRAFLLTPLDLFIPGDANQDGQVNIADLGILAANWQQQERRWVHGDFNGDGMVNIADLGILAANWQAGVGGGFDEAIGMFDVLSGVAVPEPVGAILPATLLWLVGHRRLGYQPVRQVRTCVTRSARHR